MKRENSNAVTSSVIFDTASRFLWFGKSWRNSENTKFSPRIRQCCVTLGIVLVTISLGMVEGYSAILLPQLQRQGDMEVDQETASWIASISALPTPVGCVLGGWLMEVVGRKTIHMLTCIPCIAGWIVIYFSTSTTSIMIGRLITGICVGILGPPSGVYAAETSDPTFRGFLLAAISLAITLGIALSHVLGTFISWQNTALVACVFPITSLAALAFVPESPAYLAKKRRISEAEEAFHWCRGHGEEAESELKEVISRQAAILQSPKKTSMQHLRSLSRREFVTPLSILLVFFFTNQWCGNNAMTFYNVDVIEQTLGGSFDEYLAMIIMDVIRVALSVLACYLLQRVGRRPLALTSCVGTAGSLLTLSSFAFLSRYYSVPSAYSFIPLVALFAYMSFITIGIIPLPWTMMGELFPLAYRGIGSGISSFMNSMFMFSVVKTTPWMFGNLGTDGTFLLFGVACLAGTTVLALFLPETKDKPLHIIEDSMKGVGKI